MGPRTDIERSGRSRVLVRNEVVVLDARSYGKGSVKVSDFDHHQVGLHSSERLANPLMLGALRLCVMRMWCVRALDLAYLFKKDVETTHGAPDSMRVIGAIMFHQCSRIVRHGVLVQGCCCLFYINPFSVRLGITVSSYSIQDGYSCFFQNM